MGVCKLRRVYPWGRLRYQPGGSPDVQPLKAWQRLEAGRGPGCHESTQAHDSGGVWAQLTQLLGSVRPARETFRGVGQFTTP